MPQRLLISVRSTSIKQDVAKQQMMVTAMTIRSPYFSEYCVPGIVLSALHLFAHIVLATRSTEVLLLFAYEEMEAQRG